jgi:hypothetical protein
MYLHFFVFHVSYLFMQFSSNCHTIASTLIFHTLSTECYSWVICTASYSGDWDWPSDCPVWQVACGRCQDSTPNYTNYDCLLPYFITYCILLKHNCLSHWHDCSINHRVYPPSLLSSSVQHRTSTFFSWFSMYLCMYVIKNYMYNIIINSNSCCCWWQHLLNSSWC